MPKNSVAERALRDMSTNNFLRQRAMRGSTASSGARRVPGFAPRRRPNDDALSAKIERRVVGLRLDARFARPLQNLRHVGLLHEAVARRDAAEAVLELFDRDALRGSDLGHLSVTTDSRITCSCSTLLCLRWCSRTTGTPSFDDVMNTAVPGTRGGLRRATSPRKRSSGKRAGMQRLVEQVAARFHVVMSVNTTAAMTSGTQPPCAILITFAAKNVRSIARNASVSGRTCAERQFHRAAGDDVEEDRRDRHRAGDRDAVRRGERVRALEAEDEHDAGDHQQPVDLGNVDLPGLLREVWTTVTRGE